LRGSPAWHSSRRSLPESRIRRQSVHQLTKKHPVRVLPGKRVRSGALHARRPPLTVSRRSRRHAHEQMDIPTTQTSRAAGLRSPLSAPIPRPRQASPRFHGRGSNATPPGRPFAGTAPARRHDCIAEPNWQKDAVRWRGLHGRGKEPRWLGGSHSTRTLIRPPDRSRARRRTLRVSAVGRHASDRPCGPATSSVCGVWGLLGHGTVRAAATNPDVVHLSFRLHTNTLT
jgi:hypothetical protein